MTNAEKFLKDGVDLENFTNSLCGFVENWELRNGIKNFLKKEVKPTLTEDEKVILKNIGEGCISLMRNNGEIYFHTEGHGIFPNLFQFIKERRRIRNKGVAER